jgi:hypothetical protein
MIMVGNMRKYTVNKPGGANTAGNMRDAVDLETAVMGVNIINKRIRHERQEAKAAKAKANITLPTLESLAKLLKD